ncbi:MAG: glycoside hydrolase family 2 [Lachnospiraceae bacterium]|nr:glycoside hydrolase family 2 [Lachnospiraceae bacterium]
MHAYRKDYPRPQMVREHFELLNGAWEFAFDDNDKGHPEKFDRRIQVPFTYETESSGIGDETFHPVVWYRRTFQVEGDRLQGKRLLLHFEGVDFEAAVWVNGKLAGGHRGAYARFTFDITELVSDGENELVLRAKDNYDMAVPRGKQRWKDENFGCWYVQTTGIWKSVWMEYVGSTYIRSLKLTPKWGERKVVIEADVAGAESVVERAFGSGCADRKLNLSAEVTFQGKSIRELSCQVICGKATLEIDLDRPDLFEWGLYEWRPDAPGLYDVELVLTGKKGTESESLDCVSSYFGMREIRIENGMILLNGAPLYQRLILDQGYWRESHLTPPNEEALIKDIDAILAMGYNGVRKHQKIEDERFLYWCDVKGLLVWSEMGAAYQFNDDAVEEFTGEWMEVVRQNYSHPCIITWTPFNESWGIGAVKNNPAHQHFTEGIYHLTKCFDPYRPVIVNDGWEHTVSDIVTLHDYEEKGEVFYKRYAEHKDAILSNEVYHCGNKSAFANGYSYQGQPIIISEFGGIAFNEEGGWGYGNKVTSKEDFIRRFDDITTAIKRLPYVCGFCYTQVSDVQQEINGLMDADRHFKIEPEIIREINTRRL